MLTFTLKLLTCFSCISIFLINTITLAQTGLLSAFCENASNYTLNSTYRRNLDTALAGLPTTNSGFGFFNMSIGQGDDRVNSVALCRGDINLDVCKSCLNASVVRLRSASVCPNQKEAIGYYNYCILKYSNNQTFGNKFRFVLPNLQNSSDAVKFNEALRPLLSALRNKAADGGLLRKFATGNTRGPDFSTIFALVQCTPDLSETQCNDCIEDLVNGMPEYLTRKIGGRILLPMCNFRYETYKFFNDTADDIGIQPPPRGKKNNTTRTIVVVVAVVAVIIIASIYIFWRWRKKKPTDTRNLRSESSKFQSETMDIGTVESLQYDFSTIKEATNDFSEENKLGRGGFGAVYRGTLRDGQEVAVKRLARDSRQGDIEFTNEVLLVAKLQHRNLVRLLGFSIEGSERLLIYEFLPNASLDHFIFDPSKRTHLDWEKRHNIIKGIAKGLLYLHEDSRLTVIHRDMKASNVLLDAEMNPKIADFGMARLFKPEETEGDTSQIVGTYGYMAPEYIKHGQFSVKSDVFSFGVLVLEIVTGQQNRCFRIGENDEDLLSFAWKSWKNGTASDIMDPVLTSESDSLRDIVRSIHIGLLCVQERIIDRPTMADVVLMLNSFSMTLPKPSEPAFFTGSNIEPELPLVYEYSCSPGSSGLGKSSQLSVNNVSISDLVPR